MITLPTSLTRRLTAATVIIVLTALVTGGGPSPVHDAPGVRPVTASDQPVVISGLDAHDGTVLRDGSTYYLYGTRYGPHGTSSCTFTWGQVSTPWCGFGVWTSTTGLGGPWTYQSLLFSPTSSSGTFKNEDWQTICGGGGDGCFNPRMIRRPDGAWVLWFDAPHDVRVYGANQFWVMGCNGPAGPCGSGAGAPFGSTIKPALYVCNTGGDFSLLVDPADPTGWTAYLACGTASYTISIERLQPWWTDGTGVGTFNVAGLSSVEGAGVYRTPDGTYVMTYGGNCAYCSGTDTSYAFAPSPLGPWSVPAGAPRRRELSGDSCGGQPRTAAVVDGQAYEWIDEWYDQRNETNADVILWPLLPNGPWSQAPDGTVWHGGLARLAC